MMTFMVNHRYILFEKTPKLVKDNDNTPPIK